ncbi:hypothetical protein EW146_g3470 [Bondarzewia mesenterica]|uniref:Uncharacterized protein n=1 Tax=Bondarzewia mesenterica TaxID=1095465 RepID=A0A4S4LXD9_9AGAM|nr:hypothetical protein EW146_g3470 [Bondarzewia mesenterica]
MDPDIDVCMLLGYPADEIWLLETAQVRQLVSQPDPKRLAKFDPRVHFQFVQNELWNGVMEAAREIIDECRIPNLRLRTIWISDRCTLMCWSLPAHMWHKRRTPEDTKLLEKFKEIIGETKEPRFWPSSSGAVPMKLRGQLKPPERLFMMAISNHPGWVDDYVDVEIGRIHPDSDDSDDGLDEDSYEDSDDDFKLGSLKVKAQGSGASS